MLSALFIVVMGLGFSKAQTCVYMCQTTGAYGYAYGSSDVCTVAYNYCVNYGGVSPVSIFSTYSTGYGAIAVGTSAYGTRVIGVSAGYSNPEDARLRAINECVSRGGQYVYIQDSWYD